MEILGIDIGGTGMKAAVVDTVTGNLLTERHRIPTPQPAKPEPMANVIVEMIEHFQWSGVVGVCFPTVIVDGVVKTKSNLDEDWVNVSVEELFKSKTGNTYHVLNDADAAGIAEMTYGVGKGKDGLVLMVTVGTGLGTGLFYNGTLIPNIELGHAFGTDGQPIERYAADSARKREGLKYKEWAKRFDFFLHHIKRIIRPDYVILGGGTSKKYSKFEEVITCDIPIFVAEKLNNAGLIGAALNAQHQTEKAN